MEPETTPGSSGLLATVAALSLSLGIVLTSPAGAEPDKPKPKPGDDQAVTAGPADQARLAAESGADSHSQAVEAGGGTHRDASRRNTEGKALMWKDAVRDETPGKTGFTFDKKPAPKLNDFKGASTSAKGKPPPK